METIHGKMSTDGRIYISVPETRKSPDFFPKSGKITIGGREAYVYESTEDRYFIKGLKGYIKKYQEVDIVKKNNNEYYIKDIRGTQSQQQQKNNNNSFQSVPKHTDEIVNVEYKAVEVNSSNSDKSVEGKAVRIFEQYLHEHSDRFAAIVEGGKVISDIRKRRDGYKSVFADYVVYDRIRKENVYFEIKGTAETNQYWGGVTFKELKSALENKKNYYFVIICTDNRRKDHFIHSKQNPDDPYSLFMDLDEFITYSTRASLSIQFIIKYSNGVAGGLQKSKNGDNAYKIEDIVSILDNKFIQKLISGK